MERVSGALRRFRSTGIGGEATCTRRSYEVSASKQGRPVVAVTADDDWWVADLRGRVRRIRQRRHRIVAVAAVGVACLGVAIASWR